MELSASLLSKITKQFKANQQAIARIKKRIDSIEGENNSLAQLLSQTHAEAKKQFISINSRKAVEKRNSIIKY